MPALVGLGSALRRGTYISHSFIHTVVGLLASHLHVNIVDGNAAFDRLYSPPVPYKAVSHSACVPSVKIITTVVAVHADIALGVAGARTGIDLARVSVP